MPKYIGLYRTAIIPLAINAGGNFIHYEVNEIRI